MAGKAPNLAPIRQTFIDAVESADDLIGAARKLEGTFNPKKTDDALHPKQVRRIVELGFMGVVSAWEEFVESVFVRYLASASSPSGFAPTLRAGKGTSVRHAYQVVSGNANYDPEKHFLKFSDVAWVVSQARFYFDHGKPFDVSAAQLDLLKNAASIRNRVAHASRKCRAEFLAVAKPILSAVGKKPWQGFRPGDLLLTGTPTLYQKYSSEYRALASKIVP